MKPFDGIESARAQNKASKVEDLVNVKTKQDEDELAKEKEPEEPLNENAGWSRMMRYFRPKSLIVIQIINDKNSKRCYTYL